MICRKTDEIGFRLVQGNRAFRIRPARRGGRCIHANLQRRHVRSLPAQRHRKRSDGACRSRRTSCRWTAGRTAVGEMEQGVYRSLGFRDDVAIGLYLG